MDQYFIAQQGAMRRLMQIRKDASSNAGRLSTVIATRKDGTEIRGIEEVLLDLRAGRVELSQSPGHWPNQRMFVS